MPKNWELYGIGALFCFMILILSAGAYFYLTEKPEPQVQKITRVYVKTGSDTNWTEVLVRYEMQ